MYAAEQLSLDQTEPLPWVEICRRYPDQYVCWVDIRHDELGSPEIDSARVVGYGPTRRTAFRTARGPQHEVSAARGQVHDARPTFECAIDQCRRAADQPAMFDSAVRHGDDVAGDAVILDVAAVAMATYSAYIARFQATTMKPW